MDVDPVVDADTNVDAEPKVTVKKKLLKPISQVKAKVIDDVDLIADIDTKVEGSEAGTKVKGSEVGTKVKLKKGEAGTKVKLKKGEAKVKSKKGEARAKDVVDTTMEKEPKSRNTILQDIEALKDSIEQLAKTSNLKVELLGSQAEKAPIKALLRGIAEFTGLVSGDFWITINGWIYLWFERKTLRDYSASLRDGRWKAQKSKSKSMPVAEHRRYYLIEDPATLSDDLGPYVMDRKTIVGGLANAMIRDGYGILQTTDESCTALWMLALTLKAYKFGASRLDELKVYPIVPHNFDPTKAPLAFIQSYNKASLKRKSHGNERTTTSPSTSPATSPDSSGSEDGDGKGTKRAKIESTFVISEEEREHVEANKGHGGSIDSPEAAYLFFLSKIRGMGKKAEFVAMAYPTIHEMTMVVNDPLKSRAAIIAQLAQISLVGSKMDGPSASSASGGKKRKPQQVLGPTWATKIYERFRNKKLPEPAPSKDDPPLKPKRARAKAKAKTKSKSSDDE